MTHKIITSTALSGNNDVGFEIDSIGTILNSSIDKKEWPTLKLPIKFDTTEFVQRYGVLDEFIDILEIGFWCADGSYEAPDLDFLMFRKDSQESCNG